MGPEDPPSEKLENANELGFILTGDEAIAGRKDAIFHVAKWIQDMDEAAFDDTYRQLTDPSDNDRAYIVNFERTVDQLTRIISLGKV